MPEIRIGDRLIGDGHPAYIIAEIGVNHNGIFELAIELIDAAARCGVDAVKFQKRSLDKIYPKKYLDNANVGEKNLNYLLPILQQVELSDEQYYKLAGHSKTQRCDLHVLGFRCRQRRFPGRSGHPSLQGCIGRHDQSAIAGSHRQKGQADDPLHRHVAYGRGGDHGQLPQRAQR